MVRVPKGAQIFFEESGYQVCFAQDYPILEQFKKRLYSSPGMLRRLDELLYSVPGYWESLLWLLVDDASLYNKDAVNEHMLRRGQAKEALTEIEAASEKLFRAISKAKKIGDKHSIHVAHFSLFDLIETAAQLQAENDPHGFDTKYRFETRVKPELEKIKYRFDGKYRPDSEYLALAFSRLASEHELDWDINFDPIKKSSHKRHPKAPFLRGFWDHLKDRAVRCGSLPDSILKLTDSEIADLGNMVLNLPAGELITEDDVKKSISR